MEAKNMNLGNLDRSIRVILGFIIFLLGIYVDSLWGFYGFILVFSGMFGYDPIYALIKVDTRTTREKLRRRPRATNRAATNP